MTRRRNIFALALLLLVAPVPTALALAAERPIEALRPTGTATFDHSAFDALLKAYVKPDGEGYNRVDYAALKADAAKLDAYLAALEKVDPTTLSPAEAHAFWINLYNAKTLDVVLDAYPLASIKDIDLGGSLFKGGPWSKEIATVNGQALSLDDIEHRIVRAIFRDSMSHYGLNCASYSCPNLARDAFTGANLKDLLEKNGRAYVNHPRGLKVEGGRITASRIYKWYAEDFGGTSAPMRHWLSLAEPPLAKALQGATMGYHMYDWRLNDVADPSG